MAEQTELSSLAAAGELDALEERWLAAFAKPPTDSDALSALLGDAAASIETIAERGEGARAKTLLQVVPGDVEADAAAPERLAFIRQLARHEPEDPAMRRRLRDAYRARYKKRRGLDRLLEMAGLYDESVSPTVVDERLAHFMRYQVDALVRHPSWGAGKIRKIDRFSAELVIDFDTRKRHRMAPDAAVETLELLDTSDFDARGLADPEGLKQLIDEQPLEALKLTIGALGGETNLNLVRDKLRGAWIADSKWTAWWGRAKKGAYSDPYVEVNEHVKPVGLALREEAKSAADEAVEQLKKAHSFRERWEIAKRFLRHEAEGAEVVWHALDEELERDPHAAPLDDLVALTEARRERGMPLDPLIALQSERLVELLESLPMAVQRELAEGTTTQREDWPEVLGKLYDGDSCKIRGWVREQLSEDDPALLAELDDKLTQDPMRDPQRYVDMASRVLAGRWPASAATSDRHELAIDLMQLARQVENRKLTNKLGDLPHEIAELLAEKEGALVVDLIENAPMPRVHRAAKLMHGTRALGPVLIQAGPALDKRDPNLELKGDLPFWDEAELLATAGSIEVRRAEMVRLMEEEMPAAEKAIGEAAAFGDLSENAEWTAAIERRNQLVERIEKMKRELGHVQALEQQPIDANVVCPGTKVKIRALDGDRSGEELHLTILGPWDVDVEAGIVSYLSPLAGGLLGLESGAKAVVELPEGKTEYEVLGIEKASW